MAVKLIKLAISNANGCASVLPIFILGSESSLNYS